jgi:cytochrome c oxidase cbb3-type subunit 3
MSAPQHPERDEVTGIATTGHEWDGIRELDNPLPRWWLILFWATIIFSIVYWVLMPSWPIPGGYTPGIRGHSDRANVAKDVAALQSARSEDFQKLLATAPDAVAKDGDLLQFAMAAGQSAFGDNCATCHGYGGAGAPGYPSLADNVWIWGGTLADIEQTLKVGIRSTHPDTRQSIMPAYGRDKLLSSAEIQNVAEYVVQLGGGPADAARAARGAVTFAEQCSACHGATGQGDRSQGAPVLTDAEWMRAGPSAAAAQNWTAIRASILRQLEVGGGGVMPTWQSRLDAPTIRALAIYVHSLGGGEATPAPVLTPAQSPAPATTPAPTPIASEPQAKTAPPQQP